MSEEVDQFSWLSLGVKNAADFMNTLTKISSSMESVGSVANHVMLRVQRMVPAIQAGIGVAFAAFSTNALVGVNSGFEQMQLKMAQTLRFIGVSTGDFSGALDDAATMIARIESSAARLPGEAADYSLAMAQAGAHVNRAVGDFDRSYSLIEKMTAVGISIGHNGAETAMLLERALDSQRGLLEQGSMYAQSLVNAMRSLPGHAHMTVTEFNKLKLEKRVEIMEQVVGQYDAMIAAAGNTWDSISGAALSTLKTIARLSSASMFDGVKNAVSTITLAFQDSDGNLTHMAKTVIELGNLIGGWVGTGLEKLGGAVAWVGERALAVVQSLDTNPFFLAIDRLYSGAADIFSNAETVVGPIVSVFSSVMEVLGYFARDIMPPLIDLFLAVVEPIWRFVQAVISVTSELFEKLKPALSTISSAIGTVIGKLVDFFAPVISFVGDVFITLYELTADLLVPAFEALADVVRWIADNFDPAEFLAAMSPGNDAELIRKGWEMVRGSVSEETQQSAERMREGLADFLARITATSETRDLSSSSTTTRTPPGARGGGRTVQDFRYSRFEIQQKFEEGFDPDRIAVAFASDVGRLGEQRLQSGFEPLFGVR